MSLTQATISAAAPLSPPATPAMRQKERSQFHSRFKSFLDDPTFGSLVWSVNGLFVIILHHTEFDKEFTEYAAVVNGTRTAMDPADQAGRVGVTGGCDAVFVSTGRKRSSSEMSVDDDEEASDEDTPLVSHIVVNPPSVASSAVSAFADGLFGAFPPIGPGFSLLEAALFPQGAPTVSSATATSADHKNYSIDKKATAAKHKSMMMSSYNSLRRQLSAYRFIEVEATSFPETQVPSNVLGLWKRSVTESKAKVWFHPFFTKNEVQPEKIPRNSANKPVSNPVINTPNGSASKKQRRNKGASKRAVQDSDSEGGIDSQATTDADNKAKSSGSKKVKLDYPQALKFIQEMRGEDTFWCQLASFSQPVSPELLPPALAQADTSMWSSLASFSDTSLMDIASIAAAPLPVAAFGSVPFSTATAATAAAADPIHIASMSLTPWPVAPIQPFYPPVLPTIAFQPTPVLPPMVDTTSLLLSSFASTAAVVAPLPTFGSSMNNNADSSFSLQLFPTAQFSQPLPISQPLRISFLISGNTEPSSQQLPSPLSPFENHSSQPTTQVPQVTADATTASTVLQPSFLPHIGAALFPSISQTNSGIGSVQSSNPFMEAALDSVLAETNYANLLAQIIQDTVSV
ncbi:hypothetical protein GQ42DRAFT_157742 [Ramicandelaber brevisporus]|nr:hypothetical protein GQ42DRAFT_157742 [Ramicandelaber brevisporus]